MTEACPLICGRTLYAPEAELVLYGLAFLSVGSTLKTLVLVPGDSSRRATQQASKCPYICHVR